MKQQIFIYIALLAMASSTYAQILTGTLNDVKLDDGYIVINEKRILYRGDVVITYNNVVVSPVFLGPGIKVNYTTNNNGSIKTIRLIGPIKKLKTISQH